MLGRETITLAIGPHSSLQNHAYCDKLILSRLRLLLQNIKDLTFSDTWHESYRIVSYRIFV